MLKDLAISDPTVYKMKAFLQQIETIGIRISNSRFDSMIQFTVVFKKNLSPTGRNDRDKTF